VSGFLVVGAGAIGGYVAAVLASHGAEVDLLARGRTLDVVRDQGLRIDGGPDACTAEVTAIEAVSSGSYDAVLVATKAQDTAAAVAAIGGALDSVELIVALQNGVGRGGAVSELVGRDVGLDGVVYLEARMEEPGVVTFLSGARRFELGDPSLPSTERAEPLAELLQAHGLHAVASADPVTAAWRKMILVATANSMTGATRTRFGDLIAHPDGRRVAINLLEEGAAVARAAGARLDVGFVDEAFQFLVGVGPELRSSMLHDVERGRPTEVAYLNGEIVRQGTTNGVPTPSHAVMQLAIGGIPPA
jgi:2-dehydropantoate 2-reductase